MRETFKIFSLLLLVMSLNACMFSSRPLYELPVTYDETAPDLWKMAWNQGCESGFSVYGNSLFKSTYKFKQDVKRMSDPTYYKGWRDSFNYCRAYINRYLAGESKGVESSPTVLSDKSLDFKFGNKRDDAGLYKTGLFSSGKDTQGMFGDFFSLDVPLYGGVKNLSDDCDWLFRCGADKPKDPMDALIGG